jgi:hypothetical protein
MSAIRAGSSQCNGFRPLIREHGATAFVWEVLEHIAPGPGVDERLHAAEFRLLQNAKRQHGELLLSHTDLAYPVKSTAGKKAAAMSEFRRFCLARGLIPGDELCKALSAYMSAVGKS